MKSTEIGLVTKHLENVSSAIFKQNHAIISDYVSRQSGVYALYRKGALYYVGLATNLRSRLKTHLRDIHARRWDRFSAYLTADDQHLRELEALLIRIAQPKGNSIRGHFPHSENLQKLLKKDIMRANKEKLDDLLGINSRRTKPKSMKPGKAVKAVVKGGKGTPMIALHKGTKYKAWVYTDGHVRLGGRKYPSMRQAGLAIIGGNRLNAWVFWRLRDKNGEWVYASVLRKHGELPFQHGPGLLAARSRKAKAKGKAGQIVKLSRVYKGKTYRATLRPDGKVKMGGKLYGSLSGAAVAILNRPVSGPVFWKVNF